MKRTLLSLLVAVGLGAAASACATGPCPQYGDGVLVAEHAVGHRFVQEYYVHTGVSDQGERLYDLYLRVCDMTPDGQLTRCADSLILSEVERGDIRTTAGRDR